MRQVTLYEIGCVRREFIGSLLQWREYRGRPVAGGLQYVRDARDWATEEFVDCALPVERIVVDGVEELVAITPGLEPKLALLADLAARRQIGSLTHKLEMTKKEATHERLARQGAQRDAEIWGHCANDFEAKFQLERSRRQWARHSNPLVRLWRALRPFPKEIA